VRCLGGKLTPPGEEGWGKITYITVGGNMMDQKN